MKAYIIQRHGSINDIENIETQRPVVGNKEVLVKVNSAAINAADLKVISGKEGGKFVHSSKSPIRLGFDFSGVVEAIGPEVSNFKQGDQVFGFLPYSMKTTQGSFADYVVVKSDTIAVKPSSISHTEAATAATTGSTALQGLVRIGEIKPGQKVLINGASGGVGSYAIQVAKGFDAKVWGTCSAKNLDYIRSLGADHALDYRKTTLKDLNEQFDIVLDAACNSSFGECAGILAPKGIYITLLPSLSLVTGLIRSLFSTKKCIMIAVKSKSEDLARLAQMINDNLITAQVGATYPITELQKGLEKLKSEGVQGKIGIVVEE